MLAFERREIILSKLKKEKKVFVAELAKEFTVSEETIRRDLERMEKNGQVIRNYGGAMITEGSNDDLPYETRSGLNLKKKQVIAKLAMPILENSLCLMADTSSTVYEFLKTLKKGSSVNQVITNSVDVLGKLDDENMQIISTGGQLRLKSHALVGGGAIDSIRRYNVDFAVLSCKGISIERGITDTNDPECLVKQAMIEQANKTILLVDSTKFGKHSFINIFSFSKVDYIVTDAKPSDEWIEYLNQIDVELIYP